MNKLVSDDGSTKIKIAKRDRLTFRQNTNMGIQMQTNRQSRSKLAEKLIGFEALQMVSGTKQVSSKALVSSLVRNPSMPGIETPNQGSF